MTLRLLFWLELPVVLISVGLITIDEYRAGGLLLVAGVVAGLAWTLWLADLLFPTMPRCPDCGSYRRGFTWIGMNVNREGNWQLENLETRLSLPILLPPLKGSVLQCACGKYWFRDLATWRVWSLTPAPPRLFAQRVSGSWKYEQG